MHALILGLVGFARLCEILVLELIRLALCMLVGAQPMIHDGPLVLMEAVLGNDEGGDGEYFTIRTLYPRAQSANGSATRVSSSLAIALWTLPWVADSSCKPRKAMSSDAPSSAPNPAPEGDVRKDRWLLRDRRTLRASQRGVRERCS